MIIQLDLLQTTGLAVLLLLLGREIKKYIPAFQKYFIPAPVIGGLIFSVIAFILERNNIFKFEMNVVLQDFFMNVFFCCTGFTASFTVIKKSGKQGLILAIVAVGLLFLQNGLGVALCHVFGINKLLGIAMGSISMSGGVGSGAAFGPTLEALGADGGTTVGIAAATFGLMLGSLVGGPVAQWLIVRYNLKSHFEKTVGTEDTSTKSILSEKNLFMTTVLVLITAAGGSIISILLNKTGITFPYYVGCLFAGAIVRNLADAQVCKIRIEEIDIMGNISLNLFLSMTLMSLNIGKLLDLALPMIVILIAQAVFMAIYAYFITFSSMGKSYDAAVMAAGHCGVGLGQTPNAIANMSAVIEQYGPAPNAWFVLPVITVIFINLCNPLVITLFINMFS